MHFSTATFKVAVWGSCGKPKGPNVDLGRMGSAPAADCRDVEMGGWMGWTPESKSRPRSTLSKNPGSASLCPTPGSQCPVWTGQSGSAPTVRFVGCS